LKDLAFVTNSSKVNSNWILKYLTYFCHSLKLDKMKFKMALIVLLFFAIVSCTKKETTPPTAGEVNSGLLAGTKGSAKKWKLTSISESYNGGALQTVTASSGIPTCESDNIFQFSYNSAQSYTQTEGSTTCNYGGGSDPNTIESGSWAFTDDGKSLLIDATYFPTSTQFQNESPPNGYFLYYFILAIGKPLTVVQLTSSTLKVTYSGTDGSNTWVDTLVFVSVAN
jgi:hypothetical protein